MFNYNIKMCHLNFKFHSSHDITSNEFTYKDLQVCETIYYKTVEKLVNL